MKKNLLFIILLSLCYQLSAQDQLSYKPFEAFNNDTLAFMDYNFRQRREYYKGKTVGKVLEDISLPIKLFGRLMAGNTTIGLYVYTDYIFHELKGSYVLIYLETPVNSEEIRKLKKENLNSKTWTPEIYELLKNEKVKAVAPNHFRLWKEKGIRMY